MHAIAFDLVVADKERHHPKGVSQACPDIVEPLNISTHEIAEKFQLYQCY